VRIVKEGLPDFSPQQIRKMKKERIEWEELQQCRRRGGADFACVADKLFPGQFKNLSKCWTVHKSKEKCGDEIFQVCERLHTKWSSLVFAGSQI
jgi:hypothetical protein